MSPHPNGRRSFLTTVGSASLLAGCGGAGRVIPECRDPSDEALVARTRVGVAAIDADVAALPASEAFPLGVASGDATAEGIVLWTRYDGRARLGLMVWREDGDAVAAFRVVPADGGFAHVFVDDLEPGERYRYAWLELDGGEARARSDVGRFRTALPEDARTPLQLAAFSCVSWKREHDALARAGREGEQDLLLLLGDTSYNDGAETLCEYRHTWGQTLSSEGWRLVRARSSLLATWDDHEVANDFCGPDVSRAQIAAGRRAFFEHQPVRRFRNAPDRIWRSRRWGRTAEIFVLDCRGERVCRTRGRPDATMISETQRAWLQRGLAESPCAFKIVMTSVPIADVPVFFETKAHDRWEAWATQRRALLRFVERERIDGVFWIGGDLHIASAGRVGARPDDPGWGQLEVLAGPGAQQGSPFTEWMGPPQYDFADPRSNVTTFDLDPETLQVRVRFVLASGEAMADLTYDLSGPVHLVRRR